MIEEPQQEWEKRQNPDERLRAYGPDLLGDQIDPATGGISFEQTDVSLPGNSSLEVALRRRISQGYTYAEDTNAEFGDWEYAVPRITVVTPIGGWIGNRCTSNFATTVPFIPQGGGNHLRLLFNYDYSQGVSVEAPGFGSQQILESPQGAQWPVQRTHVTAGGWYFTCTTASDGGQGFFGRAPNGDLYRFDRYILMPYTNLGSLARGKQQGAGRKKAILAATQVTDVNGNWVNYTYDGSGRLTRIEANDGRRIDLAYSGSSALVSQVTSNPQNPAQARTWTYGYRTTTYLGDWWNIPFPAARQVLSSVTQPDGRAWSFTLDAMAAGPGPDDCANDGKILSVTSPYGVTGTFALDEWRHRQGLNTMMPQVVQCPDPEPSYGAAPPVYIHGMTDNMAVTSKTLSGPGIATATWSYNYEQDFGPPGSSSGDQTNWTAVTEPGGTTITYYHYWQDHVLGGKLARKEVRQTSGGSPIETRTFAYSQEGSIGMTFARVPPPAKFRTLDLQTTVNRLGDTYDTLNTYDSNFSSSTYSHGFPTRIEEWSSTAGGTANKRVADIVYAHNTAYWVLGLRASVTRNGKLFESYTYDTLGRRLTQSNFGVLRQTLTYNADGTIATAKDSHNHVYTLSSWKRGQPQTVSRPGGTTFSRIVDDNGWVTSETNPRGYATGFSYNGVGWLTFVDYPAPFNDVTVSYSNLGSTPTETRTRGSKMTTVTYDAMFRPTLVATAATDGSASTIYERSAYDIFGRETFKSWPSASPSPVDGVNKTYDALSRPLSAAENVSPYATTTTAYLAGGQTRVTDPANYQTTTTARAFGDPDKAEPTGVVDAMGATTSMSRDIYGNITTLSQSGNYNGFSVSVTRSFWYDANLRLCRHRAPEFNSGGTQYDEVFLYDSEGLLTASGRGVAAATGCVTSISSTVAVNRAYDVLHRETGVAFPMGTPAIARTYDNNGNVLTADRGTGTTVPKWSYVYDALDAITQEKLTIDGRTYQYAYARNANDDVTTRTGTQTSTGTALNVTLDYDPDAFGRPRSARAGTTNYVTGVSYHPNGAAAGANFLNGQVFSQTLDARQKPYVVKSAKAGGATAEWLTYAYDVRGQINSIADTVNSAENRAFGYDGLGRLTSSTGPWGNGTYIYDPLSNIRSRTDGPSVSTINYASNNRVTTATVNGTARTYAYDSRGNTTSIGATGFTYDYANQPVTVTGTGAAAFTYDANLKRVKEVRAGKTIYTVYSRVTGGLIHRDQATDAIKTEYASAGGASYRLKKVGTAAATAEYIHADHLGTPIAATDASGAVTWRESYRPFGKSVQIAGPAGANTDNTGFTGHLEDDASGLVTMQARLYDPLVGRFLSTDPVGYEDQLNLYAYVANDPVNKTDPTGMGGVEPGVGGNTCSRVGALSCSGSYSGSITMRDQGSNKSTFQITPGGKTYTANHTAQGQGESAATEDPSGFKEDIENFANIVTLPIGGPEIAGARLTGRAGPIIAENGTKIVGFTKHGINRAIGDGLSRAGVKPQAALNALKNPTKITSGVDKLSRPFQVFEGQNARVVVNPESGEIVSMNPYSGGAH